LAEFASVVDAVRCAVETQKQIAERNADLPGNRRMLFRIGVNLGDIIDEGDRIYGEGVNIAARLESLAEAGGICLSGTAFDQVQGKLDVGYKCLGEQNVKNIREPVMGGIAIDNARMHDRLKAEHEKLIDETHRWFEYGRV
jgi:adenylate cyclase